MVAKKIDRIIIHHTDGSYEQVRLSDDGDTYNVFVEPAAASFEEGDLVRSTKEYSGRPAGAYGIVRYAGVGRGSNVEVEVINRDGVEGWTGHYKHDVKDRMWSFSPESLELVAKRN